MKKSLTLFNIMLIGVLLLGGCVSKLDDANQKVIRPVQVQVLAEETKDTILNYVGTITADDLVKYSYKSGGILSELRVKKGDQVSSGAILAKLDTSDSLLAVNGAQAQMEAAKAQYDKAIAGATDDERRAAALNLQKAEDAYNYANDNYVRLGQLYEAGAISTSQYEGVKLEVDIRQSELEQAQAMYNQVSNGARQEDIESARAVYQQSLTNYQYQTKQYREAALISGINGYVAEILYNEGELVPPGYPVVVVRSTNQVINVGLPQKEVDLVAIGQHAMVAVGDQVVEGVVTLISEIPNMDTLTYDAEIVLLEGEFRMGMIAEVAISVGDSTGIWIPITSIMFSGENFVYTVEENIVVRKSVVLGESHGNMVFVTGLNVGDQMIIANAGEVKPGDQVSIIGK